MFTGIITHIGEVVSLETHPAADTATLTVDAGAALEGLPTGGSLAVDGVCLTALPELSTDSGSAAAPSDAGHEVPAPVARRLFRADLMGQTLAMTSLGDRRPGDRVNLERCLRPTDHLDGHLVQGHVDGVGTVLAVTEHGDWTTLRIAVPAALSRYTAAQGAVALQGVSLTVSAVSAPDEAEPWFEVGLIPATLEATTLGGARVGDRVNVETDVMARYAERLALLPTVDRA